MRLAEVLKAVESNQLTRLQKAYHDDNVKDGTQWVVWIRQGEREKSAYFDNLFPPAIKKFADELDAILAQAGLENVTWQPVPEAESRKHERELWDSIKR